MDPSAAPPLATAGGWLVSVAIVGVALAIALWLRPWRALDRRGPPWPWLAVWMAIPFAWSLDRIAGVVTVPLLSLAPLLVLLAGWPLTVLALLAAAPLAMLAGALDWAEALLRLVWLGILPATLALGLGALSRRWLPRHLAVYILGRGYFATLLATAGCALVAPLFGHGALGEADQLLAKVMTSLGEASISGLLTAGLVAFRPRVLATYADRLYLPV
jgi:uncharacterized membrane protein